MHKRWPWRVITGGCGGTLIERLKRRRQPMREMGKHPAVRVLGQVVEAFRKKWRLSHKGMTELKHDQVNEFLDYFSHFGPQTSARRPCPISADRA
jgi:hypothetical protein